MAEIVAGQTGPCVGVVVSAMGGMTNSLLELSALAAQDDKASSEALAVIASRYKTTAHELLDGPQATELLRQWDSDAKEIDDLLGEIAATKALPPRSRDIIAGYGELWSARLLATFLKNSVGPERAGAWIDARELITVRQGELGPAVLWNLSRENLARNLDHDFTGIVVMTGFIAVDEDGLQTTLGRNGSDYSAVILAALTDADRLDIWTDVDGVMSADPRRVPDAQIIHSLSYNEAMELAYFGARVIHPQTLAPAIDNDIAVVIRNTFRPEHPGSRIGSSSADDKQIKGITAIGGMALINLEGSGMIGVPGTADRLFASLKSADVSVTLISQASSEHSICIAVPFELAGRATQTIKNAFVAELDSGQIQSVDTSAEQSIIAVVGDGMTGAPGIAARFFASLARAGINIRAIAQGSSERNISAVVDSEDVTRALRAVHSGFYLSAKTISVGIIGTGVVGGTLLEQIYTQADRLRDQFGLDLRVRAIVRSTRMLLGARHIEHDHWRETLDACQVPVDFDLFEQHVNVDHLPHSVIIDCTADESIAGRYAGWLSRGIHVITPNKKAFSGNYSDYASIRASARAGGSHYFYETTVGAALPIIRTIRDLIDTGDRIHSIEGILSGTLAYLFNIYDGSTPFSEIVIAARDSGYTEPDPRDDLSGMDVARKLTILARELGQEIELGDFPVENLIPTTLRDTSVDDFLSGLAEYDDDMHQAYTDAQAQGKVLRYVATLNASGEAEVGLKKVSAASALGNLQLTDNIVQFVTDRYAQNPLVIQGPGAGPEVTAGGVFGDLLRLAAFLGSAARI